MAYLNLRKQVTNHTHTQTWKGMKNLYEKIISHIEEGGEYENGRIAAFERVSINFNWSPRQGRMHAPSMGYKS